VLEELQRGYKFKERLLRRPWCGWLATARIASIHLLTAKTSSVVAASRSEFAFCQRPRANEQRLTTTTEYKQWGVFGRKHKTRLLRVLGVTERSTDVEIKSAYRKLAMTHHPTATRTIRSEEKFKEITEATRSRRQREAVFI